MGTLSCYAHAARHELSEVFVTAEHCSMLPQMGGNLLPKATAY